MGCIKTKNPIKLLPNSISQEMENNDNSIMAPSEIKNKVNEKNKEKFLSNSNNINLQHLTDMSQSIKIKAIIPENPRKAEENYKVICKLGKGSFGSVYKVIYIKSSNIRAMKVIKKSSINYQDDF